MMEATNNTALEEEVAVELCQTLTKYLHALEENEPTRFESCFFVCARTIDDHSRYQGLSEICGAEPVRPIVRELIADTPNSFIAELFFRIAELGGELAAKIAPTSTPNAISHNLQEAVTAFNALLDCVRVGGHEPLFNRKAEDSWSAAFQPFAKALECVKFPNSILWQHVKEPPFVFYTCSNVERELFKDGKAKQNRDPVAEKLVLYGRLFEQLVFGPRPQFHYCFLSAGNQTSRVAVCLWTGGSETRAFERVKEALEREVEKSWNNAVAAQGFAREVASAQMVNQRWKTLYEELLRELRGPDVGDVRAGLFDLNASYWACYDVAARRRCLEELESQRGQHIVEQMKLGEVKSKLSIP